MKIYIETFTGMGQTYNFDVDSSITIKQLKELFLKNTNNNKDIQSICFVFNEEELDDDDRTLSDCNIEHESILQLVDLNANHRSDFSFMGAKFADISNNKGLKRVEWSKTGPPWRTPQHGLCLEGLCTNTQCKAYNQCVIMPIGYKKFDILIDPDENTTKCPLCQKFIEPKTCAFNNCWWRYQGIKQDETGQGKPPMKCSSEWQQADNAYHYFDEYTSGIVIWKQLIVEAVKNKP
jgi:ubiquitin C